MIQLTPHMRILVATTPVDFRGGIDFLAGICRKTLREDPMSGALFVFRNRRGTGVRVLVYDGQGFWMCYKRLSSGSFRHWPKAGDTAAQKLKSLELMVLLGSGDPGEVKVAPDWRPLLAA